MVSISEFRLPFLKNLVLTCLLVCFATALLSQSFNPKHNNNTYMYQGNSLETEERPIVFYFFPYHGTTIDLRPYKKLNPDVELVDKVAVQLPFLGDFIDTIVGVAHLEFIENTDTTFIPVICIVGDFNTSNPTFYFDHNMDKDFSDETSTYFSPRKKYFSIVLKDQDGRTYGFSLENFKLEETHDAVDQAIATSKKSSYLPELEERTNKLAAGLTLNVGFGQIRYAYKVDSSGLNVNYLRNFSATGLAASGHYNYKNVAFNARISYDNIFYWTSTKTVQITRDLILEKINRDIFPSSRFSVELGLGYDLKLGPDVIFTPYVGYSMYQFNKKSSYQPERSSADKFTFEKRNFLVAGFRPQVLLNSRSSAFMDFAYKRGEFAAKGFFEAQGVRFIKHNTLNEVRVSLGMTYRFF